MTLFRFSLTGRLSRVRLFRLKLAELSYLKANSSRSLIFANEKVRISRRELMRYLERGGMPGMFAIRDESERIALLEDWLALSLERDLRQIPKVSLESDLARRLLIAIARTEEPTAGSLAKQVGCGLQKAKLYLDTLCTLFIIQKLLPHPRGTGKPIYFLGDVSFASYFQASFERQLQTWLLQEISSQLSYRGEGSATLYYYRGSRGGIVDLVIERRNSLSAIKLLSSESLDERELQVLLAWKKKERGLLTFALGGLRAKIHNIQIFPWEAIG